MIKLLRIDDRLLHGQVAFSWSNVLSIDTIIIVNDAAAVDEITKMMLGIAKPRGTELSVLSVVDGIKVIKNHVNNGKNVMVIISNVSDAYSLTEGIPELKSINFGGIKEKRGIPSKRLTGSVTLTMDEVQLCKKMIEKGIELEIRQVPEEKKNIITNSVLN